MREKRSELKMKDYKKLKLPLLTTHDEEYQMLIDVAELFAKQEAKTNEKKSGDATEITVRNHLLGHGLRMALNPELTVRGYDYTTKAKRIDGLLLKDGIDQNKRIFEPEEVKAVLEIKNNGVAKQSGRIHEKFKKLEDISKDYLFGVIVLSEKLLSPTPYADAIYEEDVDIEKCKVFTCVLRREWYPMYQKAVVINKQKEGLFWKTGEWQDCINYLK
jgi:hypothetical protein